MHNIYIYIYISLFHLLVGSCPAVSGKWAGFSSDNQRPEKRSRLHWCRSHNKMLQFKRIEINFRCHKGGRGMGPKKLQPLTNVTVKWWEWILYIIYYINYILYKLYIIYYVYYIYYIIYIFYIILYILYYILYKLYFI